MLRHARRCITHAESRVFFAIKISLSIVNCARSVRVSSMANSKFFASVFVILCIHKGECVKCFSCNSKNEKRCLDPFVGNVNGSLAGSVIDCTDEASTRQFIEYFSNLMSLLGVPIDVEATKHSLRMTSRTKKSSCQKVVINDEFGRIVIRDCAVLSDIACDSLKSDSGLYVSYCDVCDADYCNHSTKSVTNGKLLLFAVVFAGAFLF